MQKFINENQVMELTGIGKSIILKLRTEGSFPKRHKIYSKSYVYLFKEIEEWIEGIIYSENSISCYGYVYKDPVKLAEKKANKIEIALNHVINPPVKPIKFLQKSVNEDEDIAEQEPIRVIQCDKFLREPECINASGLTKSTLYKLEKEGNFPKKRQITTGTVGWLASEVNEWIQSRMTAQEAVGTEFKRIHVPKTKKVNKEDA